MKSAAATVLAVASMIAGPLACHSNVTAEQVNGTASYQQSTGYQSIGGGPRTNVNVESDHSVHNSSAQTFQQNNVQNDQGASVDNRQHGRVEAPRGRDHGAPGTQSGESVQQQSGGTFEAGSGTQPLATPRP